MVPQYNQSDFLFQPTQNYFRTIQASSQDSISVIEHNIVFCFLSRFECAIFSYCNERGQIESKLAKQHFSLGEICRKYIFSLMQPHTPNEGVHRYHKLCFILSKNKIVS